MSEKVYKQIIKNNNKIKKNKERFREQESVRLRQILKDYNKDKIKRTRICKDCHLVKCDYNGRDNDLCRFYRRFNALYITTKKKKKKKKKAMTMYSGEGKKHLQRLHEEERRRKEVR